MSWTDKGRDEPTSDGRNYPIDLSGRLKTEGGMWAVLPVMVVCRAYLLKRQMSNTSDETVLLRKSTLWVVCSNNSNDLCLHLPDKYPLGSFLSVARQRKRERQGNLRSQVGRLGQQNIWLWQCCFSYHYQCWLLHFIPSPTHHLYSPLNPINVLLEQ